MAAINGDYPGELPENYNNYLDVVRNDEYPLLKGK